MANNKARVIKPKNHHRNRSRFKKDYSSIARKFILFLIPFTAIVILFSIICANIFSPENQVKSRLAALAADYYENAFYEKLIHSNNFSGDPETALRDYQDSGLPVISVRQLYLYNPTKTTNDVSYLIKYCDENATTAKIYPEPPYSQSSYRVEYTYSCNF